MEQKKSSSIMAESDAYFFSEPTWIWGSVILKEQTDGYFSTQLSPPFF